MFSSFAPGTRLNESHVLTALRSLAQHLPLALLPTSAPNTFRLSQKTGKLRVVPKNQQLNATQKIFVGRTRNRIR
ncbi:MAG: hypothetical protein KME21_24645 [Desmonostoc vinosum HA7617-LM4]|nr:hypothetical protein [Desmonostoc vinosum HA7617-LM4]